MNNDLLSDLTIVKHELRADGERQPSRVIGYAVDEINKLNNEIEQLRKENEILLIAAENF